MSEADREAEFREQGRKLFAGEADFFFAAAQPSGLPAIGAPEIAFAGRSNVGKSSLVNALTGRNGLARASNTPGRTRELIFFDLGGKLTLVDMPGYGYASVSKEMSAGWVKLVRDYLRGRPTLLRAFVLVDGRHGIKAVDEETFTSLDKTAVSYAVVLTKRDEVKPGQQGGADRGDGGGAEGASGPLTRRCSSLRRRRARGVPELRAHVARLLAERGATSG